MRTRLTLAAVALAAAFTVGCGQDSPSSTMRPPRPGAPPVSRHAELDGRRVHYLDAGGGGVPLVLVHGWASDHRAWSDVHARLARQRRVIALDLPGHGGSEEPARSYDMDLLADGVTAVMDDAGLERAVLVGHSNGVPVVRQAYRHHPDRVAGLVLVDGPLRRMFDEEQARGFVAAFSGADWRESVAGFVDSMPHFELGEEEVTAIREMAVSQPKHAVVGGLEAATASDVWGEDPIEVPTLVLLAEQPAWTPEYETFVRRLVPDVDYRTWSGVSHFLMVDRPEEFAAVVEEFADGAEGADR